VWEQDMTEHQASSLDEVVLGAFLEDIGKFMQRAHSGNSNLDAQVSNRASIVLPGFQGRSSHWHALWTDQFFHELEQRGVTIPGVNLNRVRASAVFHHNPSGPLEWLSAEADRLSAGMDRKPRDEQAEDSDAQGRSGFRRTALRSLFAAITLDGGQPNIQSASHAVAEFGPNVLAPGRIDGDEQELAYRKLWPQFVEEFVGLCRNAPDVNLFHEGLLSISERFTWAIPSSTVDQPDVSLHDHNRSVAAIACCLYLHHRERDELGNEASVRDRVRQKFRYVIGDLSGIQSTLFRLASQQVAGVARILRARSFLLGAVVDSVALACCRKLGLPPYCLLQSAGGRFLLLAPNVKNIEQDLADVRSEVDDWMIERYLGDLTINLAVGPPFAGQDLMLNRLPDTMAAVDGAIAAAKLRPLDSVLTAPRLGSTQTGVIELAYPFGACRACGVRPAANEGRDRCSTCDDEHAVGRALPKAYAVLWTSSPLPAPVRNGAPSVAMPCGLWLAVLDNEVRGDDRNAWNRVVSGYRLPGSNTSLPPAVRWLANYVRVLQQGEHDRRFDDLSQEARQTTPGDVLTFEHLAALSRDARDGRVVGRPMLAVLKSDVDRLGQIFSWGLQDDRSLGRSAALSRMIDAFFTVVLPDLLKRNYPNTYTVYAGGDDLLLLGPWSDMMRLADEIRESFRRHVAGNPQVTLSAGLEFCGVAEPLNRSVLRAESRLQDAKDQGRDRVSAVVENPMEWSKFREGIKAAETIDGWFRSYSLSAAFIYKALRFAREKTQAEAPSALMRMADWRARWGYHLRRAFDPSRQEQREQMQFFDELLGSALLDTKRSRSDPELPLTIAIYRNR
jgi:CRISPR-associated protein Csm1